MKTIYEQAIDSFGKDKQIDMMIEECSELIQSLCKHKRGLPTNVEEEIADVKIMISQMEIIFKKEFVELFKVSKIDRLKRTLKRIEEEQTKWTFKN